MKRFVLLLLSVIMAFGVTGCGSRTLPPVSEDEEITITLWASGQWKGDYSSFVTSFIKDFNDGKLGDAANNLNITVDLEFQDNLETMISTSVMDIDNCPNIMIWDRFFTPTYAYQDFLQPIDSYVEDIDTAKFNSEALKEMNYYAKKDPSKFYQYGLPLDVDPWGVYVNMNIIEAHNTALGNNTADAKYIDTARLNNEWTWWDVLDIGKRLTGKTTGRDVFGFSCDDMQQHFFKYMVSAGVDPFVMTDPNDSSKLVANVQNQQGQDVLSLFNTMYQAGIGKKNVEDITFVSGDIVMLNQATYYGKYIEKFQDPNAPINYKFLPQPRYSGITEQDHAVKEGAVNGGMIGGYGLAIPKLASALLSDPDTAAYYNSYVARTMKFMKWWAYGEGAKHWAKYTSTLPALTELYSDTDIMKTTVQLSAKEYVGNYKIRDNVRGFVDFQKSSVNGNVETFMKSDASNNTESKRSEVLTKIANSSKTYLKP